MRKLILAAFVLLPFAAHAATDTYGRTITCSGSGPVTCSSGDGTSVQAPTAAQALGTFNGMAPAGYVPPVVTPTTIASGPFLDRFTPAEFNALLAALATNPTANAWFNRYILAAGTVSTTDPNIIAGMTRLVTAGILTGARAVQIGNLGVASP